MSRAYSIETNAIGNYFWLILIFKQYKNANNANFGSFEKPQLKKDCMCKVWSDVGVGFITLLFWITQDCNICSINQRSGSYRYLRTEINCLSG